MKTHPIYIPHSSFRTSTPPAQLHFPLIIQSMQPFNKYFPPDFDPKKHNSVNSHVGQHPLRDRARKLKTEGILIVRFEMPFNIWCLTCNKHIGMGVRYNAQKKKIGNYYSTPIWSFRMKCHLCDGWIEIHTDPKNTAYVVVSGARKKVEEFEPEDNETIKLTDAEEAKKLATNAFYKLEHAVKDEQKAKESAPRITGILKVNDDLWKDDFQRNQLLRRKFRTEKKQIQAVEAQTREIQDRNALNIELVPESSEDKIAAKLISFEDKALKSIQKRKTELSFGSIFNSPSSSSLIKPSNSNSKLNPTSRLSSLLASNHSNPNGINLDLGRGLGKNYDKNNTVLGKRRLIGNGDVEVGVIPKKIAIQNELDESSKRRNQITENGDKVQKSINVADGRDTTKNDSKSNGTALVAYDSSSGSEDS